jgi:hypothetical protein
MYEFTQPRNHSSPMPQYTLADINRLREYQQSAHRGRSIYSDMRSISEEQFRNALELNAMPIIERLLETVQEQHKTLCDAFEFVLRTDDNIEDSLDRSLLLATRANCRAALAMAEPFVETHADRIKERCSDSQRSR